MTSRPQFSVIVPFHGVDDALRRCLAALAAIVSEGDEIIIVDDGGEAGPAEELAREFGVRLERVRVRSGPAAARNLGCRCAKGEILCFADADVVYAPDTLEKFAAVLASSPDVAAVIGSYDDEPWAPNFLSQYRNLQHHFVHQHGSEEAFTFWGGCGAIRREVFRAMGGFRENYGRPSIEDIELGYRLRAAGHRIRLEKGIQVKHLKRWDIGPLLRADLFYRAIPWTELILRHGGMTDDLNLKLGERASVMLACLVVAALAAGVFFPPVLAVAACGAGALLAIHREFYRFLGAKRGLFFAARAIPWHWFYFLYCGVGFGAGLVVHALGWSSELRPSEGKLKTATND